MIWSVSTSARSSTATRPSIDVDGVHAFHQLHSRMSTKRPLDGRRGGHLRADQVGAAAGALAALEVAVRGRGAALALAEDVRVHSQAHRAARLAPLEAGASGRPRRGPPPRPAPSPAGSRARPCRGATSATLRLSTIEAASRRSEIRELVQEPMKIRSSGISSIGVPASGPCRPGRARPPRWSAGRSISAAVGHGVGHLDDHPGVVPQVTIGESLGGVDLHLAVEARRHRRSAAAPARRRPRRSPSARPAGRDVVEGGLVRGDDPGRPPPSIVMLQMVSPVLHRQRLDRRAGVLDRVALHAARCRGGRSSPGSGPWRVTP